MPRDDPGTAPVRRTSCSSVFDAGTAAKPVSRARPESCGDPCLPGATVRKGRSRRRMPARRAANFIGALAHPRGRQRWPHRHAADGLALCRTVHERPDPRHGRPTETVRCASTRTQERLRSDPTTRHTGLRRRRTRSMRLRDCCHSPVAPTVTRPRSPRRGCEPSTGRSRGPEANHWSCRLRLR